jgi:hypothetical protein
VRFYSPEWVAAFNDAVAGMAVGPAAAFRLVQVVDAGPDGTISIVLHVDGHGVRMALDPAPDPAPDVTVSLGYDDAVALARGESSPALLLGTGRVKVRGDLGALARGQAVLAEAVTRVASLSEVTTF